MRFQSGINVALWFRCDEDWPHFARNSSRRGWRPQKGPDLDWLWKWRCFTGWIINNRLRVFILFIAIFLTWLILHYGSLHCGWRGRVKWSCAVSGSIVRSIRGSPSAVFDNCLINISTGLRSEHDVIVCSRAQRHNGHPSHDRSFMSLVVARQLGQLSTNVVVSVWAPTGRCKGVYALALWVWNEQLVNSLKWVGVAIAVCLCDRCHRSLYRTSVVGLT